MSEKPWGYMCMHPHCVATTTRMTPGGSFHFCEEHFKKHAKGAEAPEPTCDNCPFKGQYAPKESEFAAALFESTFGQGTADRIADIDFCLFEPKPRMLPERQWCGRHPRILERLK